MKTTQQTDTTSLTNLKLIKIESDDQALSTIFQPGEPVELGFAVKSLGKIDWKRYTTIEFQYIATDIDHNLVSKGIARYVFGGNSISWIRFKPAFDENARGWFKVELYAIGFAQNSELIGTGSVDICITMPPKPPTNDAYLGINIPHNSGSGAKLSGANIRALQTLGVNQIRVFLKWNEIQPRKTDEPDFRILDRAIKAISQHGIKLLPVIVGTPDFAANFDEQINNKSAKVKTLLPDYRQLINFLNKLVNRYKCNIHTWQIWNEPNSTRWLTGGTSAYGWLFNTSSEIIKQIDPDAKVIMAGLSGAKTYFTKKLIERDTIDTTDAVCFHPYRYNTAIPENANSIITEGYGDEKLLESISKIQELTAEKKQLWCTEGGYQTFSTFQPGKLHEAVTEKKQAQLLIRNLALANAAGVKKYYLFELFDTYGAGFGLLKNQKYNHQPKPSFAAVATFERLAGDMLTLNYSIIRNKIHRIKYISRNRLMTLIWSESGDEQLFFSSDDDIECVSMVGQSFMSSLSIIVGESPVYLHGHPEVVG